MTLPGRLQTAVRLLHANARRNPPLGGTVKRLLALAAAAATWSCSSDASKQSATDSTKPATAAAPSNSGADLTGAGATFPYPLYSKWFSEYPAKTGVKINY